MTAFEYEVRLVYDIKFAQYNCLIFHLGKANTDTIHSSENDSLLIWYLFICGGAIFPLHIAKLATLALLRHRDFTPICFFL